MITKVHDGYGRVRYVEQNDLNANRHVLALYTKGGVKISYLAPGDRRAKHGSIILRENICLHDQKTYKEFRIFPGDDVSKHCPICTPQLNEYHID